MRIGGGRITKKIWQAKSVEQKRRGRPTRAWNNKVIESQKNRGATWNEGVKVAKDEKKWRNFSPKQFCLKNFITFLQIRKT